MKLRLDLNTDLIKNKRGLQEGGKAQSFVDNEVIRILLL